MGEISRPTLIMHAWDDALGGFEHAKYANRCIPGSELVFFETGGHGLLSRMVEAREHGSQFLKERVDPVGGDFA